MVCLIDYTHTIKIKQNNLISAVGEGTVVSVVCNHNLLETTKDQICETKNTAGGKRRQISRFNLPRHLIFLVLL